MLNTGSQDFVNVDDQLLESVNSSNNTTIFCYNITIINDNITELNETFIINIVSYDSEVELQNNATLVTIIDDDSKFTLKKIVFTNLSGIGN